jgi:hypothetical protein
VEPVFTIGYVSHKDIHFNHFTLEDVGKYLGETDGNQSARVNVHAWLTLPTLEIIDMTFLTTNFGYFLAQGYQPWLKFVTGTPDELKSRMDLVYHPMLLGINLFEKMGSTTSTTRT